MVLMGKKAGCKEGSRQADEHDGTMGVNEDVTKGQADKVEIDQN
jgi:hypothetical protein